MLLPDTGDTSIVPGQPVYSDDKDEHVFYALPDQPRIRLDEQGKPVFGFYKYRNPVPRPDGSNGGGLLFFDCEFVLSSDTQQKLITELQTRLNKKFADSGRGAAPAVELRMPTWRKGTASVNLKDVGDNLVDSVWSPSGPSLYGSNITPFTVEFGEQGATLFWQILQGAGGSLEVSYQLTAAVACPVDASAWFYMTKYYDFVQHVQTNDPWIGDSSQVNDLTETFRNSGAEVITATFPPGTDPQLEATVMDHLYKFLESMLQGQTPGDIAPVSDQDRNTGAADTIDRHITISKTADFGYAFHLDQAIDWQFDPQGTLPNITTIPGVKWSDYAFEVDLNDPFLRKFHLTTRADADFANLPIDSVDVTVDYGTNTGNSFHFASPNDIGKLDAWLSDNQGKTDFVYRYVVNYRDEHDTFTSRDLPGQGGVLTIPIGELGIFDVTVEAGALNFDQVPQTQVTLRYQDPANHVDESETVTLDKDHRTQRVTKVIFAERDKAFTYEILYILAGSQYTVSPQQHLSDQLFINGPFANTETVTFVAGGDLDTVIDSYFLDITYTDAQNNYTQTKNISLDKKNSFFSWSFPVIDLTAGKITYSGTVAKQNHTQENIPETTTDQRLIVIGGDRDIIQFQIVPDLIDWTQVRLVTVHIHYAQDDIDQAYDVIVHKGDKPAPITLGIHDPSHTSYTWNATFYMATTPPTRQVIADHATTDPVIVLDLQEATPNP
jgi:hypothetical protein